MPVVVQRQLTGWSRQFRKLEMPQVQLLRSCGRLCAHAETNSSRVTRQVVDVPIVQVVVLGRLVPQIMEEITEVIQLLSRSWRLVPQITEEITEVIQLLSRSVASRATDHEGNREGEQLFTFWSRSWRRATDHGRIRDGSVVSQVQFLRLWTSRSSCSDMVF